MPLDDEEEGFDGAPCSCLCLGTLFVPEHEAHDEVLAVFPQTMVDQGAPGETTGAFKYVVAGGDHQDDAAQQRLLGDELVVIIVAGVKALGHWGERCKVLVEADDVSAVS